MIGLRERLRLRLGIVVHVRFEQRFVQQRFLVREQVQRIVVVLDLRLDVRVVLFIRQRLGQR